MFMDIFEVIDKTGRKIRMPQKQWPHIMKKHPYMVKYLEEMQETLQKPDKLIALPRNKAHYYKNYKHLPSPNTFLLVIVK